MKSLFFIITLLSLNYFTNGVERQLSIKDIEDIYSSSDIQKINNEFEKLKFTKKDCQKSDSFSFEKGVFKNNNHIIVNIQMNRNIITELYFSSNDKVFIKEFLKSCDYEKYSDIGIRSEDNGYYGVWKTDYSKVIEKKRLSLYGVLKTDSSEIRVWVSADSRKNKGD